MCFLGAWGLNEDRYWRVGGSKRDRGMHKQIRPKRGTIHYFTALSPPHALCRHTELTFVRNYSSVASTT